MSVLDPGESSLMPLALLPLYNLAPSMLPKPPTVFCRRYSHLDLHLALPTSEVSLSVRVPAWLQDVSQLPELKPPTRIIAWSARHASSMPWMLSIIFPCALTSSVHC